MYSLTKIRDEITSKLDLGLDLNEETILQKIDEGILSASKTYGMDYTVREKLRKEIFRDIRRLGILQEFIDDPEITEIMVNGTDGIFIEKKGKLIMTDLKFESRDKLKQMIWQITAQCNRVVNESSPIVDARLQDGSRVNVVLDPVALNGPILTIRRFPADPIKMEDLIEMGCITKECADFLRDVVRVGFNILVSGGTGSGKTTMLNILSNYICSNERVVTIEDKYCIL